MTSESDVLKVDTDGPVRIVTLNRPEVLNSFTDEMQELLTNVWQQIGKDPDARAVVLTGAGRAFTSGGDVVGFRTMVNQHDRRRGNLRRAQKLVDEMLRFHLPVIAAVNGPAVGLGTTIALLSDIVYLADNAFLADTHVPVGLVAGDGGAAFWPSLTSMLLAKEYLLTGDRIPAETALRMGLANHVVPPDQLMTESLAMAHRLAKMPKQALQDTKRALNLHLMQSNLAVLPFALASEEISFSTDDVREASERFSKRE